jgi:RNA polymerase sigma-70 factor (ECF subfamily)
VDDEGNLIERARKGSEDAFCRLVRLHQGRVRTLISAYVKNADVVDDLAQEAFLTAYQSLRTYRGEAPLSLWLIGVARHHVLRHLRDEARRRAREGRGLAATLAAVQAERVEADAGEAQRFEWELSALEDCVKSLPEESLRIVEEHYLKGRPLVVLAGELGKNEGALRMALLRIRSALRQCIQSKLAVGGAGP